MGHLLWGSGTDFGYSIATDGSRNIVITGNTSSTDFPLQNAETFFQGTFGEINNVILTSSGAFILKFDNAGTVLGYLLRREWR